MIFALLILFVLFILYFLVHDKVVSEIQHNSTGDANHKKKLKDKSAETASFFNLDVEDLIVPDELHFTILKEQQP